MNIPYNRKNIHNTTKQAFIVVIGILSLVFCLDVPETYSEEASEFYEFERLWPVLPQPWYFYRPSNVTVDTEGNVYVTDDGNNRIQKFDGNGNFITKWGSEGSGDGQFSSPNGITVDSDGNVYVTDAVNNRIQKFDSDGSFIAKWGSEGSGDGEFGFTIGITADAEGSVYVVGYSNNRIQKFDSDGNFITKWGSEGSGDGEFSNPKDITVDTEGNVYVTDGNNRIQKFDGNGNFITKWGSEGSGDGEFDSPYGITIGADGNVYVVDKYNYRIQKFDSNGNFITKWGSEGGGDGEFDWPGGIAVDTEGNVYVADTYNHRIQKFDIDGNFITKYGAFGSSPGQFNEPSDLVGSNGNIYVADTENNRIQVLKKVTKLSNSKAIIVAGGGPFSGNNLWDTTQMLANYAYSTLTYQGYTKDTIYYVSADTDLDLDSNGILDDVDVDATGANLEYAITDWAADADDVVVYLIDHGGTGTYRMSGTETLNVTELNSWLNTLQDAISGKVIIIYDACESGSFMNSLTPPAGKNRIVITSTSPDEAAYFLSSGTISFSNYFWTEIFSGNSLYGSFMTTANGMEAFSSQTPLIDANGNGIGNEDEDLTLAQGCRSATDDFFVPFPKCITRVKRCGTGYKPIPA